MSAHAVPVVINHTGQDRSWAEWVAWELRRAGHRVVSAPWVWSTRLATDPLDADADPDAVVVLLLSPAFLESRWSTAGWAAAVGRAARLVPVVVEPIPDGLLPPALRARQLLRLYSAGERDAARSLRDAVDGAVTGPAPQPGPSRARGVAGPSADPASGSPPPRLPAAFPSRVAGNMEVSSARVTGRDDLIGMLRRKLTDRHGALVDAPVGADGVGAEEIAREYAQTYATQYDLVWWLPAAGLASLRDGYAVLADYLDVPAGPAGDRAADLLGHLTGRGRWLLVLSGAAAPGELAPLLPPRSGHTLVVSADPDWVRVYSGRGGQAPASPPPAGKRVLAVATEWFSRRGGLSTFNRRLCRGLAQAGASVYCLVPGYDEEERQDARKSGVTLVAAGSERGPAWAGEWGLYRKPPVEALPLAPQVVIGHGRVTGRAAQILAEDHYPHAARVHILHMDPDALEWLKDHRDGDAARVAEERNRLEVDLGTSADHPFAVGLRLYNDYAADFEDPPLEELRPGFDGAGLPLPPGGGDPPSSRRPPKGHPRVLVLGRTEDVGVKGLDTAATALGLLVKRSAPLAGTRLFIRGAPADGSADRLKRRLEEATEAPLGIVVREYSADARERAADLRGASLLVMPSRAEAFGLSAVEAITAGIPVLVSSVSGIAVQLKQLLGEDRAARFVVPTGDDDRNTARWSQAMEAVLTDREKAFRHAAELREQLQQAYSWAGTARRLLAELS
ncbi:TIR domain-containing protein [Streptomyces sp. NPDC046887]|uniref:TIR domain-containing protein n=1 Tax=Streptomyces sp. NPDC046887 TaxID=3155472 RepID=UPI0033F4E392